jgi:peptidoglycan/xylan/chitin deacetylase (PgdA/CDA1 family)
LTGNEPSESGAANLRGFDSGARGGPLGELMTSLFRTLGGRAGEGSVAVLMYHRIASHVPDPLNQCVTQEAFWEQIRIIKGRYSIISAAELRDGLRAKRLPRGAVVLTFDDGYGDNLWCGAPVLRDHRAPATFFIISGRLGQNQPLLHDQLASLVLNGDVPPELSITAGSDRRSWRLSGCAPQTKPWDTASAGERNARQQCYFDLHQMTRPLDWDARVDVLNQLTAAIPRDPALDAARRVLNHAELRELAAIDGFEIGCHTVNHPMLAKQRLETQRREIFESKAQLEQILGKEINVFAYPYGGSAAVSGETVNLVRDAGFDLAFDSSAGLVRENQDPLLLPRCVVRNWTPGEFSTTLKQCFEQSPPHRITSRSTEKR